MGPSIRGINRGVLLKVLRGLCFQRLSRLVLRSRLMLSRGSYTFRVRVLAKSAGIEPALSVLEVDGLPLHQDDASGLPALEAGGRPCLRPVRARAPGSFGLDETREGVPLLALSNRPDTCARFPLVWPVTRQFAQRDEGKFVPALAAHLPMSSGVGLERRKPGGASSLFTSAGSLFGSDVFAGAVQVLDGSHDG